MISRKTTTQGFCVRPSGYAGLAGIPIPWPHHDPSSAGTRLLQGAFRAIVSAFHSHESALQRHLFHYDSEPYPSLPTLLYYSRAQHHRQLCTIRTHNNHRFQRTPGVSWVIRNGLAPALVLCSLSAPCMTSSRVAPAKNPKQDKPEHGKAVLFVSLLIGPGGQQYPINLPRCVHVV